MQAGYQQPAPVYQQSTVAVARPTYAAPAPVGVGVGGRGHRGQVPRGPGLRPRATPRRTSSRTT
ncbi:MAG: hypothetical protein R3A52_13875 [Polyangiales bacterium]